LCDKGNNWRRKDAKMSFNSFLNSNSISQDSKDIKPKKLNTHSARICSEDSFYGVLEQRNQELK
jgi:hypothetical protein